MLIVGGTQSEYRVEWNDLTNRTRLSLFREETKGPCYVRLRSGKGHCVRVSERENYFERKAKGAKKTKKKKKEGLSQFDRGGQTSRECMSGIKN